MVTLISLSEYAPVERIPITVIQRQHQVVSQAPLTEELLDSVLNHVFILNQQRQIVFVGDQVRDLVGNQPLEDLLGMRLGDALGCVHAQASPEGCGTTAFCQECGAIKAILASLAGEKKQQKFRLTRMIRCTPETIDLLVYAVPFTFKGESYSLFSVAGTTSPQSRSALRGLQEITFTR